MKRSVETTLAWGGLFKHIVMAVGELAICAIAILAAIDGDWAAALILFFIASPIWLVIADIATGLLLAPIAGIAHLFGRDDTA